jgi:hypothetical protein
VPIITEQDSATRLARAVATDLRLYNETRLLSGEDLTEEIAEARQLYRDRVEPSLYDLFDDALAEVMPELQRGASSIATVTTDIVEDAGPRPALPEGLFRDEPPPPKKRPRGNVGVLLAVLVALVIALAWLAAR